MYEFCVIHKHCGATTIIYGYDFHDACKRANKDPKIWEVEYMEYIDWYTPFLLLAMRTYVRLVFARARNDTHGTVVTFQSAGPYIWHSPTIHIIAHYYQIVNT